MSTITETGHVATAELRLDAVPTTGKLVGVSTDTYEFTAGSPGGGNTAVSPGANAAASRTNLIAAINAGGIAVKATERAECVRIQSADTAGGTPAEGKPATTPLSSDISATNVWNRQNLDETGAAPTLKVSGIEVVNKTQTKFGEIRIPTGISTLMLACCSVKLTRMGVLPPITLDWPFTADGSDLVIAVGRGTPRPNGKFGPRNRIHPGDTISWTVVGT